MRVWLVAVALSLPLFGCQQRSSGVSLEEDGAASVLRPAAGSMGGADSQFRGLSPIPGDGVQIDDDCEFERVYAHSDPLVLVQEYAQRDASGEFTATSPWMDRAVLCPNYVPGYDVATVISSYHVNLVHQGPDSAQVAVTYERVGEVFSDTTDKVILDWKPRTEADTFVVVRTGFGWRLVRPPNHWQILVDDALRRFPFRNGDRHRLERYKKP